MFGRELGAVEGTTLFVSVLCAVAVPAVKMEASIAENQSHRCISLCDAEHHYAVRGHRGGILLSL